jgi:hypothetical protein
VKNFFFLFLILKNEKMEENGNSGKVWGVTLAELSYCFFND